LSHRAAANFNPALSQKFVEKPPRAAESAGIPPAAALQRQLSIRWLRSRVANLGGGSHPVAQASLDTPSPTPFHLRYTAGSIFVPAFAAIRRNVILEPAETGA
jgi:hypothetical protein